MVRGNGMVAARRLWGWLVLALIAVLTATGPSSAQTPTPFAYWQNDAGVVLRPLGGPVPDWDVTIGMGAAEIPLYEGSDHYRTVPSPAFDIRYKDLLFLSDGDGLGVNLLRGETYRAGVALGYDVGRTQHASGRLNGIGSIPPTPVARAFAEAYVLPFIFSADIRRYIGGTDGLAGDIGTYMPVIGTETLVVFVGPGITFADDRYVRKYFGISPSQAAPHSGLPLYQAGGGATNANFGVSIDYHYTDNWMINGDIGYERMLGDAAGSPIVQSKNQIGVAVTIAYEF
jgi:outer membrane scaffolding protein for murein synthesis (MipA/OmpV family)